MGGRLRGTRPGTALDHPAGQSFRRGGRYAARRGAAADRLAPTRGHARDPALPANGRSPPGSSKGAEARLARRSLLPGGRGWNDPRGGSCRRPVSTIGPRDVLDFWFKDTPEERWFVAD